MRSTIGDPGSLAGDEGGEPANCPYRARRGVRTGNGISELRDALPRRRGFRRFHRARPVKTSDPDFGRSPAAQSLSRLGKAVGYGIGVVSNGAARELFPDADFIAKEITSDLIRNGSETFIVVATQGEHDEEALEQALSTDAHYISFIASHAKAHKVIGLLGQKGASPQMLGRIKAPAGLSIGTSSPQEMAVSIIAEIIQTQKRCPPESSRQEEFGPEEVSQSAIDPVCGMAVDVGKSTYQSEYKGKSLHFCCAGCKQTFDRQPEKYL